MVRSPDSLPARGFLKRSFPLDRPAAPALLTVPAAAGYRLAAACCHRSWDTRPGFRPPIPVISVGNITVGGTGKTPCVIALLRLLCQWAPQLAAPGALAVLSRGYGRRSRGLVIVEADMDYAESGDEPLLIKQAVPHAAVIACVQRATAADHAVKHGARLLLLDDGFQHRRLARDLDLVLVDGEFPLGNGHCLPAGPLREPASGLRRASVVVGVGNAILPAQSLAQQYSKPFWQASIQTVLPPELSTSLSTPAFLLTSIARPERVYKSLLKKGLNIVSGKSYRDHHHFTVSELASIASAARASGAQAVVVTAKDQTRLANWPGPLPLRVVDAEFHFSDPSGIHSVVEPLLAACVE